MKQPQGRFLPVPDWTAQAVADALDKLVGDERWWSPHLFAGDYREEARWAGVVALAVDLDWCDTTAPRPADKKPDAKMPDAGWHCALPAHAAKALLAAAKAGELCGHLLHLTPRGCRGVVVLDEICIVAGTFDAAIRAFGLKLLADVAALGLAHAGTRGLTFDTSAIDRARLLFTPRATVKEVERSAGVIVIRHELDSAEAWADAQPATAPAEVREAESHQSKSLPPVPWDALPHSLGEYGRTLAAHMEVPEAAIMGAMLTCASVAVPTTSAIQGRPGHVESCPLWFNILAYPGSRKTDAIDVVCEPLGKYDAHLDAISTAARTEWEEQCKALRQAAKKNEKPELPPEPTRVQAEIDDYTTESLLDVFIAMEPHGLALLATPDELTALIGGLGQYKRGGNDRQRLLSIWSGRPYRVNRKGKYGRANRPRMGLIAGVQPQVACDLHRMDTGDGFLDRFGWLDCRTELAPEYDVPLLPAELRQAWHNAIAVHLPNITAGDLHYSDTGAPAEADLVVHRLAPDAVPLWRDFYNQCDRRGLPPVLKGYGGKVAGQGLRNARGLHYLKHGREAVRTPLVDAETIAAAIRIQQWVFAHTAAVRLFMAGGLNVSRTTWGVMAWLVKQPGRRATLRQIARAGLREVATTAAAETAGNDLVRVGAAVWGSSTTTAGRELRELILTNQGGA